LREVLQGAVACRFRRGLGERRVATQVEALRRLRNGASQVVRVEYVHVGEGGQAVIGNVRGKTE
jgi:hypothetical protein